MPSALASAAEADCPETAFFCVDARAEPGVMPRVLELFAKRGLVPSAWRSAVCGSVCGSGWARLTIEIEMSGLGRDIAEYIAACLRQITCVEAVLTRRREPPGG